MHLVRPTRTEEAPNQSVADFVDSIDLRQGRFLRRTLVIGDLSALLLAGFFAFWFSEFHDIYGERRTVFTAMMFSLTALWWMRNQGLWLARVSAIRVVEITRITRALVITAVTLFTFDRIVHFGLMARQVIAATLIGWLLVNVWRSAYRTWLTGARLHDRYCRRVICIGTDDDTDRLLDLFTTHPELGVRVAGVVGVRRDAERLQRASMYLGPLERAEDVVRQAHVNGVIVSSASVPSRRLNELIRSFQNSGIHIHIATGIAGIDSRRMRSTPLAHEPLLYIERPALGRAQRLAKRAFDMVMASVALVLAAPLMLVIAAIVKLQDRGPVLFRQTRVGQGGEEFAVLKFRTMHVDAEARLAELSKTNERSGPLFKMTDDPRVTRIGRVLRSTSIDELPQLLNVLAGDMSLVGPRPALPKEVAEFPPELRHRESVTPGITGLWQVEARDNPSFEAYRRLDLFYVENWSIALDLMIVVATIEQLVVKVLATIRPHRTEETATITALADANSFPEPSAIADGHDDELDNAAESAESPQPRAS